MAAYSSSSSRRRKHPFSTSSSRPLSSTTATAPTSYHLTTSLLSKVIGGVILLHLIILYKLKSHSISNDGNIGAHSIRGGDAPEMIDSHDDATVIPYFVSMTNCGDDPFMEGAAVLKYSVHQASVHGNMGGKYDYQMFAIYHPDAVACARSLEELGYKIIPRPTPVKVEEIRGDVLRNKIEQNGCCGSKELIKLEVYTFEQFKVAVHLDLDTLILKPLDVLIDMMLDDSGDLSIYRDSVDLMWPDRPLPEQVNAFFTRDFGMIKYHRKYKPIQGGFVVVRPSRKVYRDLVDIVKEGNFDEKGGWGNQIGLFYGCMTIQGLLPYYYDILSPGQSIDLNRCVYNQMADNPKQDNGKCKTGEEQCEDCRTRPISDIVSMHFTNCLKPWHCVSTIAKEHFVNYKIYSEPPGAREFVANKHNNIILLYLLLSPLIYRLHTNKEALIMNSVERCTMNGFESEVTWKACGVEMQQDLATGIENNFTGFVRGMVRRVT